MTNFYIPVLVDVSQIDIIRRWEVKKVEQAKKGANNYS